MNDIIINAVWPVTLIIALFIFRTPISTLIHSLRRVEYKKGEEGHQISADFLTVGLQNQKESLDIPDGDEESALQVNDPKQSILEAWDNLERTALSKLKEIGMNEVDDGFREKNKRALDYLNFKGAFSPKIEAAIQNMHLLRDQVTRYPSNIISQEGAADYIKIINKIKKSVEAIQELPTIHLDAITMILRNLTHLVDAGEYNDITIEDVHKHIENETVLRFLSELKGASELKAILESDLWIGFATFYTKSIKSIYYGYAGNERRKWGIENSGLCLLIAWTNEIIQMGSGWYPNENLSELA